MLCGFLKPNNYIDLAKPKSGAPGPGCSKPEKANPE